MLLTTKTMARLVAFVFLIASLAGLRRTLSEKAEVRLTDETLSNYARSHPPKPWHGFKVAIWNVSVNGEIHVEAHISGYLIHTPVNVRGTPDYGAKTHAMFFHVSKAALPKDLARPILRRLNALLNPLATYIAQDVTEAMPVKKIKSETFGGGLFVTTVRSVRVDGDAVVVALHDNWVAAAAVASMLCALLAAVSLLFLRSSGGA